MTWWFFSNKSKGVQFEREHNENSSNFLVNLTTIPLSAPLCKCSRGGLAQ